MNYDQESEKCYLCGALAMTKDGVIYVRAHVDGKWDSYPECEPCWYKEHPDRRQPYKVKFPVRAP